MLMVNAKPMNVTALNPQKEKSKCSVKAVLFILLVIIGVVVGLYYPVLEKHPAVQCGDGGLDIACTHCTSSSSVKCNSDDCVWHNEAEFSDSGPCILKV